MASTQGWELLRQWLQSNLVNKWFDPRDAKDAEKFFYKYSAAFGMAKGSQEILDWVEQRISEHDELLKKERGEKIDKLREAFTGGDQNGSNS